MVAGLNGLRWFSIRVGASSQPVVQPGLQQPPVTVRGIFNYQRIRCDMRHEETQNKTAALVHVLLLVLMGLGAFLLPAAGFAQSPDYSAWQDTVKNTHPPGSGCFQVFYPDTQWQEVPCGQPPVNPSQPLVHPPDEELSVLSPAGNAKILTVGGKNSQNDYVATVSGAPISSATGSFINATGGVDSLWSLQLNANLRFYLTDSQSIALCGGSSNCTGWVQFVYDAKRNVGFIQYWIYNAQQCPPGWKMPQGNTSATAGCFLNSEVSNGIAGLSPSNLWLTGKMANGMDTVTLLYNGSALSSISTPSIFREFSKSWKRAQFNIFGDGGYSNASLKPGSHLTVKLEINNGTTDAPLCSSNNFTGESNNLYLNSSCCPSGGTVPAITYAESTDPNARVSCSSLGVPNPYTVTTSALGGDTYINGFKSTSAKITVAPRSTLSLTLSPSSASDIPSVGGTCGGTLSSDRKTYTTNPITADCTVEAAFAPPGGNRDSGDSGGGGSMGWLWGLGLWGLGAAALWQRRRKVL